MSEAITIARPYAQAVFETALEAGDLDSWLLILNTLKTVVEDEQGQSFLVNPEVSPKMQYDFLMRFVQEVVKTTDNKFGNFINILVMNKRIMLLPEIAACFAKLKDAEERLLAVKVKSFAPLNNAQQEELTNVLGKKFDRKISLEINVEPELLGGAVIRAGDLVIDGSVRGQLNKLARVLAA